MMPILLLSGCEKIPETEIDFESCYQADGLCEGQALANAITRGYNAAIDLYEKTKPELKKMLVDYGERNKGLKHPIWR